MGMMQDFAQARTERKGEVVALKNEVATLCREAKAGRKRTAAEDMAQRRSDSVALRSNVRTLLKDFDKSRADMSRVLRGDLDKANSALRLAEAGRNRTAAEDMAQRRSDSAALRSNVRTLLKDLDKSRADMSRVLRGDLDKVAPALRGAEAGRVRTAGRDTAQRRSDVEAIRVEVWGAAASAGVTVAPPPRRAEAPPVAPPRAEEAIARAEPVEATPEAVALRDRVFQYLVYHPDGARMTELEAEFGMARIHMATLLRSLQDDNKVEKRDLFYFAI